MSTGDDLLAEGDLRFARFREIVLSDAVVQARLRVISDWPAFVEATVDTASEHGIALSPDDLDAERRRATLGWLARWA